MDHILAELFDPSQTTTIILVLLACFRLFLEIVIEDFSQLPLSKALARRTGEEQMRRFHRMGLVFSVGMIIFFGPHLLFAS
jgi:hypothetical protein